MGVRRVATALFILLVVAGVLAARTVRRDLEPAAPATARPMPLPLMFEPDPDRGGFVARSRGYSAHIQDGEVRLVGRGADAAAVTLRFAGGAGDLRPEREMSTTVSYLRGPRTSWRTGVRPFAAVRLAQVYPGVDALFYGTGGQLEYDLIVAPGAAPSQIALSFPGFTPRATAAGIRVVTGRRTLLQQQPVAYQTIDGRRVAVDARYRVDGDLVRFDVGPYDETRPLVIDPLLAYSTYYGATGIDRANGIAADAAGNAYVVGTSDLDDMPGPVVRPHAPQQNTGAGRDSDAYVAKFRPDGSIEWIAFVGGTSWDTGNAVAVGPDGDVYIGGNTNSNDFAATAGAFHTAGPTAAQDEFLMRLAPDGTTVRYSSLLGAPQTRFNGNLAAIAVDGTGRAYVVGSTGSASFPATVWDSRSPSSLTLDNTDAFVARFSSDGARLDFGRLFGGSYEDQATAVTLDQYGAAYIVGSTCSTDFTVLNALNPAHFGPSGPAADCSPDGFLTYVWTDGSLGFSTYLGGTGNDWMTAVGQGLYDRVFVGGTTDSPPLAGAFKPSTGQSGVIYQIAPNGSALFGARYVGGTGNSQLNGLVFTSDPNWFWVIGTTEGAWPYGYTSFPNPPAQGHPGGGPDIFLQEWDELRMDTLGYSDTYGGGQAESGTGIARNRVGDIYISGYTSSGDFPLKHAAQASLKPAAADATSALQQDGVVARFDCDIHELGPVAKQPAEGGSGSTWTFVEDGCVAEPVSDASWLHVGAYSSFHVAFTVDSNPATTERTAHIVTSGRSTATITQAAGTAATPPPPSHDEVVINARDASAITGTWRSVADDVHGTIVAQPDAGQPKIGTASATPSNYVEFTFTADAGKPYHLWIHGRAQDDWWQNDSVYVQFSDSVVAAGNPIYRRETTSATWVSLEECSGCGERGWGWQDNAYGARGDLGPDIYFASSGTHTMRLQTREDGFSIGQVVLSAKAFLRTAPGGATDDPTIVTAPGTSSPPPPAVTHDEIVLWAATDAAAVSGTWQKVSDPAAAGQSAVWNPDAGAPKLAAPLAAPVNAIDLTFDADAGKPYHLWLRMKADNDFWTNDSVWVQFSGSVDAAGHETNRIGTSGGTWVSLEECSGCGEQGWGWQDNAYGAPGDLAAPIYFATSGPQTIRIQVREDGLAVDQIVLSASRYSASAPGRAKNDATIVSRIK